MERTNFTLKISGWLMGLVAMIAFGQLNAQVTTYPYNEDFESVTGRSTACTGAAALTASAWTNDLTDTQDWNPDVNGTTSGSTGPSSPTGGTTGGTDHNPGTTTGVYLFLETSSGCNNNTANLISPVFDMSSLTDPKIDFWYHMFGATMGTMHMDVSTDGGTTFMMDFFEPGWTDNVNLWQQKEFCAPSLAGEANVVFRLRGMSGTSFTSDMAFDDFSVVNSPGSDFFLSNLSPSGSFCGAGSQTVTVDVNNLGCSAFSGGSITMDLTVNGSAVATETFTAPAIAVGSSETYTFTAPAVLATGMNTISVTATEAADPNAANNTLAEDVNAIAVISTFPYLEDFEAANDWSFVDVSGNSTWELGTPANDVITGAASGSNAWITNAAGSYNTNENGYVQSPCFDLTNLCAPYVDLNVWWQSEFSWDGAVLQSTIDGGSSWQNVGANGDPNNWFNDGTINANPGGQQQGWTGRDAANGSGGYVLASHALDGLAGQSSVILRVAFGSDGSVTDNGFAFDDVMVYEPCDIVLNAVQAGGACGGGGDPTIDLSASSALVSCKTFEFRLTDSGTGAVVSDWSATTSYTIPTLVDGGSYNAEVRFAGEDFCIVPFANNPIAFTDIIPPVAVCQDIDVTLMGGAATILVADIDNGSTDNCGIDYMASSVSPGTFDCSSVGPQTVTLTIVDAVGGLTDECTATVNVFADDTCLATLGNSGGPSITDPCTCRGDGAFDEEIFLQSTAANQAWVITDVSGLTDANGNDFAAGDLMVDNGDGTYSIVGIHLDGLGYSVTVESPFFPGVSLQVGNTCFYPEPEIENNLNSVCLFSPVMTLAGNAGAGIAGTGAFTVNGAPATELDPMALGLGAHEVEFCFDAGVALGTGVVNNVPTNSMADAMADPGCVACVTQGFIIQETPSSFTCNDRVQISANENCATEITADMIMEGGNGTFCYDDYAVTLSTSVPNPVTSTYFGRDIIATVTHLPSGNKCWSTITIEDKTGPEFDCTVAITDKLGTVLQEGQVINIDCEIDPADIPAPIAIDNCDPNPYVSLEGEVETGDKCSGITIIRTYNSSDHSGNIGNTCVITINITQPQEIRFPEDVTWTCQQYEAYNSITDASAMHALIVANAASMDLADYCCNTGYDGDDVQGLEPFQAGTEYWNDGEDLDVVLDPLYDDFLQNPITDNNPACDNIATETDSDDCIANFGYLVGCPYLQDCDLGGGANHTPNNIKTPIYVPAFFPVAYPNNHPVRGLEDNDVLALTGSGIPSVSADGFCAFAVTHEDQVLEACNGVATDKVFKILRTWTVLNWCTGVVTTDVQVIKVLDKKAPVVTFNDDDDLNEFLANGDPNPDYNFPDILQGGEVYGNNDGYNDMLNSDQFALGGSHTDCSSSGLIDVPDFLDDCTGVESVVVETPVGNATPVEVNGNLVGFRIPAPYLKIGIHIITFKVSDACGNTTVVNKRIRVQDGIPPVNICREFTQISLSAEDDGITEVTAEHFDEATYDNCGPVWFKVRRMDDNCDGFDTDRTRFNDDIRFCCSDIADTVMVILRAYDRDPGAGSISLGKDARRANDCMIRVLVEDKSRPNCTPPEDVWINCDVLKDNIDFSDIDQLSTEFGTAVADDNCNATITELTPDVDVDLCGIGQVTRRFRAEDDYGNRSLGNCQQTIMIMPVNEYTIGIPGDFEEECDDASPASVTYTEVGCDLLAVNVEDEEFPASSLGECKKIIRTYQIINWCLYDGQSDPVIIPRLDINNDGKPGDGNGGSRTPTNHSAQNEWISTGGPLIFIPNPLIAVAGGGYYQYEQHIKIFDNTAPEVSYDGDTEFCGGDLDEDPCTGAVTIEVDTDDLCTSTTTRWELSAFASQFTAPDFSGDDILTGRYPLGTHTARFYVADECGNESQYDVTFTVIDCKAPTPACYNGLSIDVMPLAGMVEIWASDFNASSFDYCHPIKFAINRVTDQNGDGFIDNNDYQTTVPAFDSVQFTCSDVGTFVFVQLWVGEVSSDDVNNWDYCVTTMEVQDNNGVCGGSRLSSIAGSAKTETGVTVENVDVTIGGDMDATFTTDTDGAFSFNNLTQGGDYSITPMRTDEVTNGVSTFDLTIISKHILNVEPLNSPYKMIAADANNSGNISTIDLLAIRKVILRVTDEFPNNTSWRFIDKDQILDANPLGKVINEVKSYNDISGDMAANFVAVKIGDVNGDAKAQNLNSVDGRTFNGTFFLNAKDIAFEAGDIVEVMFTSEELSQVEGYQFTMNFNTEVVELAEVVEATATSENFGLTMVDKGIITTSWNGNATSDEAFKLVFTAKNAGNLSNVLSVSSEFTAAEAYADGILKNVGFNFGTAKATADFALYQNTPNPFENETTIGFNLPEASAATITLSDISGKVLRVIQGDYAKGLNQITLEMTTSLPAGVVVYELETSTHKATRKMTVVK